MYVCFIYMYIYIYIYMFLQMQRGQQHIPAVLLSLMPVMPLACIYVCIYICIYIYRERERDRYV